MSDVNNGTTQRELDEIHYIQSEEEERAKSEKLPAYVKCLYCGGKPTWGDLLGEVIPNSSALAHQSCMAERGQIFGLNTGLISELKGDAS